MIQQVFDTYLSQCFGQKAHSYDKTLDILLYIPLDSVLEDDFPLPCKHWLLTMTQILDDCNGTYAIPLYANGYW